MFAAAIVNCNNEISLAVPNNTTYSKTFTHLAKAPTCALRSANYILLSRFEIHPQSLGPRLVALSERVTGVHVKKALLDLLGLGSRTGGVG